MASIKHSKPDARAGWISPEGKFYPCAWFLHDSLGQNLMVEFGYSKVEDLERDWLRLKYDPTTRAAPFIERGGHDDAYSVTQGQFNALHDLLAAFLMSGINVASLKDYIQRARVRDPKR
jgi:hypothetical protein